MNSIWKAEPTLVLSVVSAGIALAIGFGANITTQQMGLIMAFVAAVLGLINRSQVTSPASLQALTPGTLAAAQDAAQPVRDVVKKLPVVLLACLLGFSACGTPASVAGRSTANLTAPGVQALHKKEVVKSLDVVRDTAVDGEASKVISTATARIVVTWHKSALEVITASAAGWQTAVIEGLAQLKKDIPPADLDKLSPYIDAATNIFKAVIQ